jgi:exosortase
MSSVEVKELKAYKPDPLVILAGLVLAAAFVWTYTFISKESTSSLIYIWREWWTPDYQHGFFVLPFCLFLLWYRRGMMAEIPVQGSWWGLALFALWAGVRLYAVYFNYSWLQHASLIPGVAAITLFVGGWRAMLWAWPAIVFMVFMIPLPGAATDLLSQPLQKIGSVVTVFAIQTLGVPSMRMENAIQLSGMPKPLNVAEACSGIRMLMLFFALCAGGAFLMTKKPWWERLLIVVSAIPIAVIANVSRLTMIALFSELVAKWPNQLLSAKLAVNWPNNVTETWAHDLPGLLMMPVGMLLLWLEWMLFSKLMIESPEDRAVALRGTTRGLLPMAAPPRESKRP